MAVHKRVIEYDDTTKFLFVEKTEEVRGETKNFYLHDFTLINQDFEQIAGILGRNVSMNVFFPTHKENKYLIVETHYGDGSANMITYRAIDFKGKVLEQRDMFTKDMTDEDRQRIENHFLNDIHQDENC